MRLKLPALKVAQRTEAGVFTVTVFERVQRATYDAAAAAACTGDGCSVWRRKMHLTTDLSLPFPLRLNYQTLVKDEQVMNLM